MKAADPTTFNPTVHSSTPVLENALNRMCHSLESSENRRRFKAFPEAYCHNYGLTREETHAVTDLDVHRMLQLGGHIQRLALLTSIYGMDLLGMGAEQQGLSIDEFHAQLIREGYISAH
jgi:protocatechuate 4,5-dioxygenase alpha subunit